MFLTLFEIAGTMKRYVGGLGSEDEQASAHISYW
jgi:hypothetical protein